MPKMYPKSAHYAEQCYINTYFIISTNTLIHTHESIMLMLLLVECELILPTCFQCKILIITKNK